MSGFLLKIWTGPDNCCSLVGSAGDPVSPFEVHQYAAMGVTTKVGGRHVIEHESILCPMTEIHVKIPPAVIKRWAAMVVEAEQRRGEVYCSVDCAGVCHALDEESITNDPSCPDYTGERPETTAVTQHCPDCGAALPDAGLNWWVDHRRVCCFCWEKAFDGPPPPYPIGVPRRRRSCSGEQGFFVKQCERPISVHITAGPDGTKIEWGRPE